MGMNVRQNDNKQDETITVRLPQSDKQLLADIAVEMGVKQSEVVRMSLRNSLALFTYRSKEMA